MLDDLVECIETLQERMKIHEESLQANEWRTRTQLIDPMLCALGWDVSDPALVTPEYNVGTQRVDYALLKPDKSPSAILEAKPLNTTLTSNERAQMVNYAVKEGFKYAGLSTGNHWELYDVFQPVPLGEKQILDLSITDDPSSVCAIKLLHLWQPILSGGSLDVTAAVLEQIISIKPPPPPPPTGDWVSLTEYDPKLKTPPPKSIRFWDGTEQTIRYWNQVLVSTAEQLYAKGKLQSTDTPIQLWSEGSNSIHVEPVHPGGTEMRAISIGDPPLFINVDMNSKDLRDGAIRLLQKYDVDPAQVYLLPGGVTTGCR